MNNENKFKKRNYFTDKGDDKVDDVPESLNKIQDKLETVIDGNTKLASDNDDLKQTLDDFVQDSEEQKNIRKTEALKEQAVATLKEQKAQAIENNRYAKLYNKLDTMHQQNDAFQADMYNFRDESKTYYAKTKETISKLTEGGIKGMLGKLWSYTWKSALINRLGLYSAAFNTVKNLIGFGSDRGTDKSARIDANSGGGWGRFKKAGFALLGAGIKLARAPLKLSSKIIGKHSMEGIMLDKVQSGMGIFSDMASVLSKQGAVQAELAKAKKKKKLIDKHMEKAKELADAEFGESDSKAKQKYIDEYVRNKTEKRFFELPVLRTLSRFGSGMVSGVSKDNLLHGGSKLDITNQFMRALYTPVDIVRQQTMRAAENAKLNKDKFYAERMDRIVPNLKRMFKAAVGKRYEADGYSFYTPKSKGVVLDSWDIAKERTHELKESMLDIVGKSEPKLQQSKYEKLLKGQGQSLTEEELSTRLSLWQKTKLGLVSARNRILDPLNLYTTKMSEEPALMEKRGILDKTVDAISGTTPELTNKTASYIRRNPGSYSEDERLTKLQELRKAEKEGDTAKAKQLRKELKPKDEQIFKGTAKYKSVEDDPNSYIAKQNKILNKILGKADDISKKQEEAKKKMDDWFKNFKSTLDTRLRGIFGDKAVDFVKSKYEQHVNPLLEKLGIKKPVKEKTETEKIQETADTINTKVDTLQGKTQQVLDKISGIAKSVVDGIKGTISGEDKDKQDAVRDELKDNISSTNTDGVSKPVGDTLNHLNDNDKKDNLDTFEKHEDERNIAKEKQKLDDEKKEQDKKEATRDKTVSSIDKKIDELGKGIGDIKKEIKDGGSGDSWFDSDKDKKNKKNRRASKGKGVFSKVLDIGGDILNRGKAIGSSALSVAGGLAKKAPLIGSLVAGGLAFLNSGDSDLTTAGRWVDAISRGTGSLLGTIGGATVGSVVGPAGTIGGGIAGGVGGEKAGGWVGDKVIDFFGMRKNPLESKEAQNTVSTNMTDKSTIETPTQSPKSKSLQNEKNVEANLAAYQWHFSKNKNFQYPRNSDGEILNYDFYQEMVKKGFFDEDGKPTEKGVRALKEARRSKKRQEREAQRAENDSGGGEQTFLGAAGSSMTNMAVDAIAYKIHPLLGVGALGLTLAGGNIGNKLYGEGFIGYGYQKVKAGTTFIKDTVKDTILSDDDLDDTFEPTKIDKEPTNIPTLDTSKVNTPSTQETNRKVTRVNNVSDFDRTYMELVKKNMKESMAKPITNKRPSFVSEEEFKKNTDASEKLLQESLKQEKLLRDIEVKLQVIEETLEKQRDDDLQRNINTDYTSSSLEFPQSDDKIHLSELLLYAGVTTG